MAKIRLTNEMRDAIIQNLLKTAFKDDRDALLARRVSFSNRVYNDLYPKKLLDQMKALPEGILPQDDDVGLSFAGSIDRITWRDPQGQSENRIMAFGHLRGHIAKVYDDQHPIYAESLKIDAESEDIDERHEKARGHAKAIVYAARTVEDLIDRWPEIEPHARPFLASRVSASAFSLAIPMGELNALLKLNRAA